MTNPLTRRRLLEAAGGLTFLALVPNGNGAFAYAFAPGAEKQGSGKTPAALPVFTALPYLQPGPDGSALRDGAESVILAWQTNASAADFAVFVSPPGGKTPGGPALSPARSERFAGDLADGERRFGYTAALSGLSLGTRYTYRVEMNGKTLAEGYFTTRKKRGQRTRFVAFGDNSFGEISDRMIAYQAYQAKPDFVMNTGDNVYEGGQVDEYERFFFPVYNADVAHPRVGAPLLRSVPFYTVIANHDVHDKDKSGFPVADFDKNPGSLAYFSSMHLPLNGPAAPKSVTPLAGADKPIQSFRDSAGARFPRMANYSYDYGDAHFLCLDSNIYVDPTDTALQAFIESDLAATDAAWKFVVYHHPAFNVGDDHYAEQHMRVLSPLFEKHGVDIVLHGHEHNYQRTSPLRFLPKNSSTTGAIGTKKRLVPGTFTVDRGFDGVGKTKASGVVYITTGAGGKHLYDPEMNENPQRWLHPEDDNIAYIARFCSDRHSLTVFEMDSSTLKLSQIDQWGNEIDRCRFTKK